MQRWTGCARLHDRLGRNGGAKILTASQFTWRNAMTSTFCPFGTKPWARTAFWAALLLITIISITTPGSASIGNIVKSDLAGTWQIALRGNSSCGVAAMQVNVTLNGAGTGPASLITHGQCGDSTLSGQSFMVTSLGHNGAGTATLTCGTGCKWIFNIQVAPNRSSFSLADAASTNPGDYLEGEAILQSPSGNISISDLTGSWQATILGETGCGLSSMLVTFTLNSSGVANNAVSTGHSSGCPDGTVSGLTFQILSMNPDGSGTANLSCGAGCGWNLNIQVPPDRSTFNLVDVSSANPGNYIAGVAINNSTAGQISTTNLAGAWQLTFYGGTGCGYSASYSTFTLNATGVATNVASTGHSSGCPAGHTTGNTFTIQSLKPDGSGTANLTCGAGCGWNLNIQLSPDRSTFNLVDVSPANPGNYVIGTAIHQ